MSESMIERASRALCIKRGDDPDAFEPGDDPYGDNRSIHDGFQRGEPVFRRWRLYASDIRAAIAAMREPTEAIIQAAWNDTGYEGDITKRRWQAMVDAALEGK